MGETFGPDEPWSWPSDTQGKTTACVGLDLTGVRQQGPHAEATEGRMVEVAMVFLTSRDRNTHRKLPFSAACSNFSSPLPEAARWPAHR